MNARELILRKRGGLPLTGPEIDWLVGEYSADRLPDYQMSAFLMATYFQRMSRDETVFLTRAMLHSGSRISWDGIPGPKADKHSTGGVGDKVSLVLAPLAACCGLQVPMISGRGLGHTGGTLDKLESMRGFRTNLSIQEVRETLKRVGCAMAGQSRELAPADKRIYALRDVTGTVECIPLIVASILSKKAAAGVESLVFDLKCGDGAFMKTESDALELARGLVDVAGGLGIRAAALVTNMEEPLGLAVGNALEVTESIECLRGGGPRDLRELTLRLTGAMILLSGLAADFGSAIGDALKRLDDGSAWRKFQEMVRAQGGELDGQGLPILERASHVVPLAAGRAGYLTRIANLRLGLASVKLGAGRQVVTDSVDPAAGIVLGKKVGDSVDKGDVLAWVHHPKVPRPELESEIAACFEIGAERAAPRELVWKVVTARGIRGWEEWSSPGAGAQD